MTALGLGRGGSLGATRGRAPIRLFLVARIFSVLAGALSFCVALLALYTMGIGHVFSSGWSGLENPELWPSVILGGCAAAACFLAAARSSFAAKHWYLALATQTLLLLIGIGGSWKHGREVRRGSGDFSLGALQL
jgi:hypothetical protein